MALRSPLARVLGLGSAKEGVSHWWWQRITAIALIPTGIWFVYSVLVLVSADQASALQWLRSPAHAAMFLLFNVVVFWHALLGLQVVIEDYIHTEWLKLGLLIGLKLVLIFLATVAVLIVLQITLGS